MKFDDKLQLSIKKTGSVLCAGLDPNPDLFPPTIASSLNNKADQVLAFCSGVIRASSEFVCAYKINTAYFEALGKPGFNLLGQVRERIPSDKIIIADAKRGDVGHTADQYKTAFFDVFDFDAITLSPLIGFDTLKPYLETKKKGIFVLTLTSNPGADDFFLKKFETSKNLSCYIAKRLRAENKKSETSIGMVVGATQDASAGEVISEYPESNLLIPGIGAQGGSLVKLEQLLKSHKGFPLISVSRGILYPEQKNGYTWEELIGIKAREYHKLLTTISSRYV